ncbi:hypothetical protein FOL47_007030 [Perkinsus chesapeaki]|uniref:Uncharacterized protein n=1 Tax=Perkinsus chesapeaki TaxID=330153 RepID=A0A7J6LN73_PERCH|nr:hypothetical protein FOL47_007030 [Perkinsus chesapeaki]
MPSYLILICLAYQCYASYPDGTFSGQVANPYLRVLCEFRQLPTPYVVIHVSCNTVMPPAITALPIHEVAGTCGQQLSVNATAATIAVMASMTNYLNSMCPGRGYNAGDFILYDEATQDMVYDVHVDVFTIRLSRVN